MSKSKVLKGSDLHDYLQKKIINREETVAFPRISDLPLIPTTLEGIVNHLRHAYQLIKKNNAPCLDASLDYGGSISDSLQ